MRPSTGSIGGSAAISAPSARGRSCNWCDRVRRCAKVSKGAAPHPAHPLHFSHPIAPRYTPAVKQLTSAFILSAALFLPHTASAAASCADLAKVGLPHTSVTVAAVVSQGSFTLPAGGGPGAGAAAA